MVADVSQGEARSTPLLRLTHTGDARNLQLSGLQY